ncbi:hypothetical protein OHA70_00305 [Kribbella sp. NBC_00382]|uniref:hypothetical protein n=1 Tax=Kribbella sp. NBC_00382 TaxID=2975967 RepID=UPI002E2130EE
MSTITKVTGDFDFLNGHFDVAHRVLTPTGAWDEYAGTHTGRTHHAGAVSVDEARFPGKAAYGMSLRLYDPVEQNWTVYWVSSTTGKLQPPVRGGWSDGVCTLYGEDDLGDRMIPVRLRWSDVTETTAHWEQAYSEDGGETWQTNWTMDLTRRSTEPPAIDAPKVTGDFDFFVGSWNVQHRQLLAPLTGSDEWREYPGTAEAYTLFDGAVSIDETFFPTEDFDGMTVRLYDVEAGAWAIYWINSKRGVLEPPVYGGFGADEVGILEGPDTHDGQPVDVRFRWTKGEVPVWEQFFSADGGATWESNWSMTFTRMFPKVTSDFDFLNGYFDVRHRTLNKVFVGSDDWQSYDGTCTARTHFDGAISIDEMQFPGKASYGMSVRLFDPVSRDWTIYWINSKSMELYPPVKGRWAEDGKSCWLTGEEELDGKPILVSYAWSDVTETTAHWEQSFSEDGGATWEVNWTMDFTRRSTEPPRVDIPKPSSDFDFLVGEWDMHNERRRPALGEPSEWYELASKMKVYSYFDGAISFDEGWYPTEGFRGATLRLYNPAAETWSIHWINSLRGTLETPVIGAFGNDGVGVFEGPDEWNGQPIDVRFVWTPGTTHAAWEQLFSTDNGQTWLSNWKMRHTRTA